MYEYKKFKNIILHTMLSHILCIHYIYTYTDCPCDCFDPRKDECQCGIPNGLIQNFPSYFLLDYVRVYQAIGYNYDDDDYVCACVIYHVNMSVVYIDMYDIGNSLCILHVYIFSISTLLFIL